MTEIQHSQNEPMPTFISKHPTWSMIAIFAVAGVLMLLWFYARLGSWQPPTEVGDLGAFGDAFAPIVGLLSSLALAAAVVSVVMQRDELRMTRYEMRLHRIAAEEQRADSRVANELTRSLVDQTSQANDLAEQQVHETMWANKLAKQAAMLTLQANNLALLRVRVDALTAQLRVHGFGADHIATWFRLSSLDKASASLSQLTGEDLKKLEHLLGLLDEARALCSEASQMEITAEWPLQSPTRTKRL